MTTGNMHSSREAWLCSATNELRAYFAALHYTLPDKIRFAIAFTSRGKRGGVLGECWHPTASEDQNFEIIIRADMAEPVEVLGVLVHELIHAVLPSTEKHGRHFREAALRLGLEGEMRHALPGQLLKERLKTLAAALGPLPHARLDFSGIKSDAPKKQAARMLKAECSIACGYTIRLAAKWARAGLPLCPIDFSHGLLRCNLPDDEDNDDAEKKDESGFLERIESQERPSK